MNVVQLCKNVLPKFAADTRWAASHSQRRDSCRNSWSWDRSRRSAAAVVGITPRENSTAGRPKLGRISRAGDEDLRRLLVIGATAVIRAAKPDRTSPWLLALLARNSKKLAAVALANKMARTFSGYFGRSFWPAPSG